MVIAVMIIRLIAVIEVIDNNCGRSSESGDQDAYGNGDYRIRRGKGCDGDNDW